MDDNNLDDKPTVKTYTQEEVDALTAGLKSKNAELLGETKTEREKRKLLEDGQVEAQREADEKRGEFKSLYERSLEENRVLKERESARDKKEKESLLNSASSEIGQELSKDVARSKLLAEQALKFSRHNEDGSISYEIGGVPVDKEKVLEHLRAEFPFLVDGVDSSGGSATGGDSSGATKKPSEMTSAERVAFKQRDPAGFKKAYNL